MHELLMKVVGMRLKVIFFGQSRCIEVYVECPLACRVMTNGDPEGRIVLTNPHTNDGNLVSFAPFNSVFLF